MLTGLKQRWGIALTTVAALAFYLYHGLWAQLNFRTTGYDLGIFDQALRAYARFKAPMVPLKGQGANILGDHFHPIIATLVPFYWIFNSPFVLIVAQAVFTAAAVPIVYRFALRRCSARLALLFALAFAFGWGVQTLIDFDFHEIAFATPILALAIDALDRRRDKQLLGWACLLLLVREDMGIVVAVLAVLLLAQRRGWRRPLALFVLGTGVYVLATKLVIPHFAHGSGFSYANQFGELGNSIGDAAGNAVLHPAHAVKVFFSPAVKTRTLLMLFGPFALLPLRSRYVWLAVPLLAERMLNSRPNLWGTSFHYNALPWLILSMAAIDGAARLGLFRQCTWARIGRAVMAVVLIGYPVVLCLLGFSRTGVVSVLTMRVVQTGQSVAWLRAAEQVTARIPADVCVIADNRLVPHLTSRDWVTAAGVTAHNPDLIVLDMSAKDVGGNPPAPKPLTVWANAIAAGYSAVYVADPFIVLRSPDYTGPSKACAPLGPGK